VFQTGHDETVKSLVIVMDDQIEKEKVMSIAWNKDVDAGRRNEEDPHEEQEQRTHEPN
jgi:hypothetical protein